MDSWPILEKINRDRPVFRETTYPKTQNEPLLSSKAFTLIVKAHISVPATQARVITLQVNEKKQTTNYISEKNKTLSPSFFKVTIKV